MRKKSQIKKLRRSLLQKKNRRVVLPATLMLVLFASAQIYVSSQPTIVDPQAYKPLLETIAKGESKGNYNAHFGNASNTSVKFTEMTVGEVLQWQASYVEQGSPSSAIGRYQIIQPTLRGLVQQMGVAESELFNEDLQDRMAIRLLERRGSVTFVDNKLSREQFAANLAQEWAALPKVKGENPEQSYYDGDGLNRSHISVGEVFTALESLKN